MIFYLKGDTVQSLQARILVQADQENISIIMGMSLSSSSSNREAGTFCHRIHATIPALSHGIGHFKGGALSNGPLGKQFTFCAKTLS